MRIGPTEILDSYAEAFAAWYARIIITASDDYWLVAAQQAVTGYGTSLIGCDAEVGLERRWNAEDSPDGRSMAAILLFAFSKEKLARAVGNRIGQCVLTCPTTACFNGLPAASETIPLGDYVCFFGDGWEEQGAGSGEQGERVGERAVWRIPVMDGEFVVERTAGVAHGVAGGNLILHADSQHSGLSAIRRALGALHSQPGIITPFPGGVCRSGSKVGSKYKKLVASTHEAFCPTLRDRVSTQLVQGANCAYEIVIDGVDREVVAGAMRAAIEAAAGTGVLAIAAGNYGGRLGKINLRLHDLL